MATFSLKQCAYKIIADSGKPSGSEGNLDFVAQKHKEKHTSKKYNFDKYTNGSASEDTANTRKKFNVKNLRFEDDYGEIDPIKDNTSNFLFDNDDAIIFNLKKNDID